MLQLADLVRLAQRAQHIEGGACPHVGTDAELNPLAPGLLQVEQPAAEEQVGGGAKAIAERVSHRQSHSCSSRCRQWANTLCRRSCRSDGKRPDSFGFAGTAILPGHFLRILAQVRLQPHVGEFFAQPLHLRQQRRVLVGAKRGVMA